MSASVSGPVRPPVLGDLQRCQRCAGLVDVLGAHVHEQWHLNLDEAFKLLHDAVVALAKAAGLAR